MQTRFLQTPSAAACAALTACLVSAPVSAQSGASESTTTFELGAVVVKAQAQGPLQPRQVVTSVDVVDGRQVQGDTVRHTWELFRRVPGVLLAEFNQGTTSGKLSFRGFNGEGEVNAVKLLIDGVPSNSNDGNMPYIDLVFPLEIDTITTVRGTNDARFGLHNIAGNVELSTRRGGNVTDTRASLGSFGLADVQLYKGIEGGNLSQSYFVGVRRSDGHRDHSASEKASLSGKWFYTPDGGLWSAGLIVRHHEHQAQEPGYLMAADAQADPSQSYDVSATDGGERRMDQLSLHGHVQLSPVLGWRTVAYQNRLDDKRWVKFSRTASQQHRYTDESHWGVRSTLSWRPTVGGLAGLAIEGGVDTERQDNVSKRYTTTERVVVSQTRDQAWRFDIDGVFVQAVIKPVGSLSIVPAYRVDRVRGAFHNRLTQVDHDVNDFGAIEQPKLSAMWVVAPGHTMYANWGRTFQVGVGAASYKVPPRTSDLAASLNDGWEAGWKFRGPWGLEGRTAYWEQTSSGEWARRLNDPSGDSDNIGATRRRGLDVQLRATLQPGVDTWLSWNRQVATIEQPDPNQPATEGKDVNHVPHRLYSAGVDWQVRPDLRLSTWLRGQSDYFIERTNTRGRFGGFTHLHASATWQATPTMELSAEVRNLTDRYSEYVWWDGTQSLHSPGEPRALSVSLRMAL